MGRYRVELVQVDVKSSQFGPMSTQTDFELSQPEKMSRRVGLRSCQAEWAWDDVDPSQPKSMSSRVGPSPCRSESTHDNFEQSQSTPCRVESSQPRLSQHQAHVEPILPRPNSRPIDTEPMYSQVDPDPDRVESIDLDRYQPESASFHVESTN